MLVFIMIVYKEIKMKEQSFQKVKSEQFTADKEILIKRVQMTENAHRMERERSNILEDVSSFPKSDENNNIYIFVFNTVHT